MSEVDTPRNDAGQFTPDTSNMYGAELANAEAGFKTRPRDTVDGETDLKAAAADLVARRAQPIEINPDDAREILGKPDIKEAVTPEQAAKDLSSFRQETSRFIEGTNLQQFAEGLDKARAEELKKNPRAADELGLSAEDVAAAKKAEKPDDAKADPASMRADHDPTAAAIDAMEGLDPETKVALKNPQVRQALEQEFTRIDHAREEYASSLQSGQQMLQATVAALAPQLQDMPLEHWPQAIQMLAQVDPARAQLVSDTLGNWSAIQQAQLQEQQRQAQVQRQQFETTRQQYSRASDEAIGPMTVAEKTEMVEELVSYVGEFGISREQFAREAETNLALHHPAFQRMAADAIKYQRMVKAPKAIPQGLPTVQRPGVASAAPRGTDNSSKIQALQKQLATANGERAARLAGKIRSLKRSA